MERGQNNNMDELLMKKHQSVSEVFMVEHDWPSYMHAILRDWSLITGRGGLQNGRGGHVKFYSYEKGGRKKF